ncbi:MAG: hypothetical protein IPL43_04415 [Micropruina sp.]|nr:hypothetical protein [Micropruina sp.]
MPPDHDALALLPRHTFMTTVLGVGADLRNVQISARHTPAQRTTTRYDRAPHNLDPHPNYIFASYIASYIASGTQPEDTPRSDSAEASTSSSGFAPIDRIRAIQDVG